MDDIEKSLSDDATFAGAAKRRPTAEMSLGDERTLGDRLGDQDTVIDDIEVVDLEARYKVEGTLGQGGMGAVLLATDTRLGRKVAVKRILGEAARSKTAIMRFLTEAKAIAALNHPNIVQIYDYGRAKDGPFLIMEYVDGGSLLDRCREGALPLEDAVDLACQLCDGLAKAHDAGIVHRDIKPANVLLNKDGLPKLTDFGLAKAEAGDHGMTMTGAVMGTPDFMPPEQRRDASEVDARSDLWSLAATVYQMVTGRSPKIIRFNDIPMALQDVLGKALDDLKDSRYQTARELRDALKGVGASKVKSALLSDELQEGQCKACSTVTRDLSKKFCRNPKCGASLRVACLKCDAQIPVWDGVCGECGGNQPALLEEKRSVLIATRSEAESLLGALAFDQALARAAELAQEAHPAVAEFAEWGASFTASTTSERDRQLVLASEKLAEAQAHVAAWDYPAATHAIESIPEPLRNAVATRQLRECHERKKESESLIATITERITRKEIDGLVPLVERAVSLRGDRKDLAKIHGQLLERKDARLTRARAAMDAGDVPAAAAALAKASMEDYSADEQALITRVRRAEVLENEIVRLVKEARADSKVTPEEAIGILKTGEEYLLLNPQNAKVESLVKQSKQIAEPLLRERILALPAIHNSLGMKLKLLPAGTFTMGEGEDAHQVSLTKPFYIGVYEVTNAHWKQVMGNVPSKWKDNDRPVEQVSWEEAVEFCKKLSALPAERQAGRVYRLPTEAEWEYACRAGSTMAYSFGDDESRLGEYAWHDSNSRNQTHPVGKKKPNGWGLYDMHGNVWEWCSDWHGMYPKGAVTDPQGPSDSSDRVSRGGGWYVTAGFCRSANRDWRGPSDRNYDLGFRLALSPSGVAPPDAEANRLDSELARGIFLRNEVGEAVKTAESDDAEEANPFSLTNAPTLTPNHNDEGYSEISDVMIQIVHLEARYKVEGTLGRGGMGEVLLALDTRLGRKVAIKRILGEAARSKTAIMRFLTEARAIAALNHPNIVQIYDYGRAKDGPFLIMEYVDGGSLLDRCREGALRLEDAVDLACQLCDGLAKAHDAGIVHRDIKPANVLLTKNSIPKLIDFGLVNVEYGNCVQDMTGAILGTPGYMPPEQLRDASEVDARSDLWSLAVTIYQMVTGRNPKALHLNLLPVNLRHVLTKALDDNKENRFQSASDFRDALRSVTP